MSRFSARQLPLLAITIVLLGVGALFVFRKSPPAPVIPTPVPPPASLSILAEPPNWPALDAYQNTITREEFERLLTTVFTTGEAWKNFIQIGESEALIKTGDPAPNDIFHLRFSSHESRRSAPRLWKTAAELPVTTPEKPLAGLKIAIDPGHIGGACLRAAARAFDIRDELRPIKAPLLAIQGEGDLYGTMAQIDDIAAQVPHAQLLKLPHCGHSPHRDQAEAVTQAIEAFVKGLPSL